MAHLQGSGVGGVGALTFLDHTFGSNVTAGSILVVGITTYKIGSGATAQVTDTLFNGYRVDRGVTNNAAGGGGTDSVYTGIHATEPIRAGGACTVRVTPDSSQIISVVVAEVTVTTKFKASNAARGATSAGGTAVATGTVTPGKADGYLFGIMTNDDSGSPTLTPGGSQTQIAEVESTTNSPFNATYRILSSTSAVDTTWTQGASGGGNEFFAVAALYEAPDGVRANYGAHPEPMIRGLFDWLLDLTL